MVRSIATLLIPLLLALAAGARGAEPLPLEAPSFPLEPGRRKPRPLDPASYVEGRDGPVEVQAVSRARPRERAADGPAWELEIRWFYSAASSRVRFTAGSFGTQTVRGASSRVLNTRVGAVFFARGNISVAASAEVAAGGGELKPDVADPLLRTEIPQVDFRAAAGPRVHLLAAESDLDLSVGVDASLGWVSRALVNGGGALDVGTFRELLLAPVVALGLDPGSSWSVEAVGRYSFAPSVSGPSEEVIGRYRRAAASLDLRRWLDERDAVGVGLAFTHEDLQWERAAPSALATSVRAFESRIELSWRRALR